MLGGEGGKSKYLIFLYQVSSFFIKNDTKLVIKLPLGK